MYFDRIHLGNVIKTLAVNSTKDCQAACKEEKVKSYKYCT